MKTTVVFGAGNFAEDARRCVERKQGIEDELLYCDNFKKGNIKGIPIISYEELKTLYMEQDVLIVIAAVRYQEIYEQCMRDHMEIAGIYDMNSDVILKYEDYCLKNYTDYKNRKYLEYIFEMEELYASNIEKFKSGEKLSNCIADVTIMISNLCNYACIHKECPSSLVKEKEIMSTESFESIILQLKEINFKGTLAFNIYNEPMMDPRLFLWIKYAKEHLEDTKALIYTNGYYLNQVMIHELEALPIDVLIVTGYGKKEYERIFKLNTQLPFHILFGKLDKRLSNYDLENHEPKRLPCRTLITEIPIYTNGDIGLCCLDYRHEYGLGNIFHEGLRACIDNDKIRKFQEALLEGNREKYGLCRGCSWQL